MPLCVLFWFAWGPVIGCAPSVTLFLWESGICFMITWVHPSLRPSLRSLQWAVFCSGCGCTWFPSLVAFRHVCEQAVGSVVNELPGSIRKESGNSLTDPAQQLTVCNQDVGRLHSHLEVQLRKDRSQVTDSLFSLHLTALLYKFGTTGFSFLL